MKKVKIFLNLQNQEILFNPKKDFKYGIYHDDIQICDEKFRESVECLSDPKYTLIIFFNSDNPKFHS